ncbi:helix-hairpin-helix domain-containing protein [Tannerella forsythia]|uniref:Kinase n=1 Tax=Tannerella forsythia TaxID=28112 RepID=A0A3P1YV24_TANFO|nr:kinase [Tannerella forsythia]RRD74545.1 kinase [Tannerella forsythia]
MNTRTVSSIINPGKTYQYVDNGEPMRGGMKDVFFSPDKSYVVAFYRDSQDFNSRERLKKIVTQYFDSFFNKEGGSYYKNLYTWPTDVVEADKKVGIIVPCYSRNFFFQKGYANNDLLKGKEKEGKWFASAKFRVIQSKSKLDESELGNWLSYFQICVNIARGVKRLHAAGLAHSDLSYKNVLIDPISKTAAIIDIDGLVVPGLFPPDVIGTADFIAPEVLATKHLDKNDLNRKLPNRLTDLHALAVLIYMYLLYRHPLRGGNYFGAVESEEEEDLLMGSKALFIEHPTDASNRNFKREYGDNLTKFYPWTDLKKTPYTITGPYLKALFDQAFIKGLHNPIERPTADAWEHALIKTNDLKLQCSNPRCGQKWFIYNNTKDTHCPFCGTKYNQSIPVLDFFYQFKPSVWKPDNQRLVVYNNSTLHQWHSNRNVIRNEKLTDVQKARVGYFSYFNNKWFFVNEKLSSLKDLTEDRLIPVGSMVEITNGKRLLLLKEEGGRVAIVSLTNN